MKKIVENEIENPSACLTLLPLFLVPDMTMFLMLSCDLFQNLDTTLVSLNM